MKRLGILLACFLLILLVACGGETKEEGEIALVLSPSQEHYMELETGTRTAENFVTIAVTGDMTFFWDIKFVSQDEKVAKVRHERTQNDIYLFYTIEAVGEGETYIHFESEDGSVSSELIRVRVYDRETPPETKPIDTEDNVPVSDGSVVYVTKSGTRYHYKKSCAGENAIAMPLEEAKEKRTPCKVCVPSETEVPETTDIPKETTAPSDTSGSADTAEQEQGQMVYVTPSGAKYHYKQSHAGKNAIETTLDEAIAAGKTACKVCVPQ